MKNLFTVLSGSKGAGLFTQIDRVTFPSFDSMDSWLFYPENIDNNEDDPGWYDYLTITSLSAFRGIVRPSVKACFVMLINEIANERRASGSCHGRYDVTCTIITLWCQSL